MLHPALCKFVKQPRSLESFGLLRLQAKSYRMVKSLVSENLKSHHISVLEWTLLGILYESPEGCQFVSLSRLMGVEPPYITELVKGLEEKKIVTIQGGTKDRRVKRVFLSNEMRLKLPNIEKEISQTLSTSIHTITGSEVNTYVGVMKKIIDALEKQMQ